ncbi:MAG: UDP-N-acetylmuramoyl-tripeptide--D-alanyl-D-alanine ligase [Betaproteobacteria bacterium]|nr:UDP-N-acetylmuramoyl-tripeptide--D-alanyl-D-alanine ligase [Betaproteobacteria bacterium]
MSAMALNLAQAQQWIEGARAVGDISPLCDRVHTDTRSLQSGDLFVALRGERFDAHDFLPQARATGARLGLAEHGLAEAGLSGLQVPNSLRALGQLAHGWRQQFQLPLVAVTGSNGKTTVTQMIASIWRAWHPVADHSLATLGNYNNAIGLPLTLLRLRPSHRCAVVELGMNHPGEIAQLAAIANPSVALVNNAQREHQEFMHSVAAVAQENGSVLQALGPDGVAVFPADDPHTPLWRAGAGARRCWCFGADKSAEVSLVQARWQSDHWQVRWLTPMGELASELHIAGQHNVRNAMAATAAALAAGAPLSAVAQGLRAFQPVSGRSSTFVTRWRNQACTVVDDTYNANPDSVLAAIDVLADLPAPHLLVLGDMGEVGAKGEAFHTEVGVYAQQRGIERLFTLGALAQASARAHPAAQHFEDMAELQAAVLGLAPHCGSVLVKGSRFMRMERVTHSLQTQTLPKEAACS